MKAMFDLASAVAVVMGWRFNYNDTNLVRNCGAVQKTQKTFREHSRNYREDSTVEGIALKLGIDQYDLYDWAKTDGDFLKH